MTTLSPGPRHRDWAPSPPRYVALDVDGTLVGPDGRVAPAVVAAAAAAVEAGLHVGIATGRMRRGIDVVLDQVALPGPHLVSNGAVVVRDDEVVRERPIAAETIAALRRSCVERGVYLEVYVSEGFLVTQDDQRAAPHWELLGHRPQRVLGPEDPVTGNVSKVTALVFDHGDPEPVVALLQEHGLTADAGLSPATPGLRYVNGTDPAVDKGRALRDAAEALGIEVAATVAVGDADNDVSMLRAAGTGIVMGQATAEVRRAGHLVAPPVTEDGAAVALLAAVDGFSGLRTPR